MYASEKKIQYIPPKTIFLKMFLMKKSYKSHCFRSNSKRAAKNCNFVSRMFCRQFFYSTRGVQFRQKCLELLAPFWTFFPQWAKTIGKTLCSPEKIFPSKYFYGIVLTILPNTFRWNQSFSCSWLQRIWENILKLSEGSQNAVLTTRWNTVAKIKVLFAKTWTKGSSMNERKNWNLLKFFLRTHGKHFWKPYR